MKMKKILFVFLTGLVLFCSCTGNSTKDEKILTDNVITVLNVEHTISTDRQAMYLKGGDYRWYETCVLLSEYLDSENPSSNPEMVSNVFQRMVEKGNGYDTWVYKFQHFPDGTCLIDSVRGLWIEDNPLNEDVINLKYLDAFNKIMQVNSPKPHSKQVCLRNPVGPMLCDAQYVFGNIREQLWVNAKTGEVVNSCPAFPLGFKMPLTEWP